MPREKKLTTNTIANVPFRVPYLGYQAVGVRGTDFDGASNYDSLQATVRKQFSRGFMVQGAYTWSKNLTNLASAYLQLGRFVDCEKTLNTILKQDDHYGQAYNIFGILAIRREDGIAARKYLEKAIECDADLTEPYLSLAFLAEKTGHPQIAISYYKKYLERTPPKEHGDIVTKIKAAIAKLEGRS